MVNVEIDDEMLSKLEKLSMIELDDSLRESFRLDLEEIVSHIHRMNDVDTDHIDLSSHSSMPLRDDVPVLSDVRDAVLSCAPRVCDGFFVVNRIL